MARVPFDPKLTVFATPKEFELGVYSMPEMISTVPVKAVKLPVRDIAVVPFCIILWTLPPIVPPRFVLTVPEFDWLVIVPVLLIVVPTTPRMNEDEVLRLMIVRFPVPVMLLVAPPTVRPAPRGPVERIRSLLKVMLLAKTATPDVGR
jgi:hypothetical protein